MVIVEDSGDWDTERKTDPRDMLVGRVFGGLPNGRLGRRSIKAGGSAGNSVLRVDPVTEPCTPSSSSADLASFSAFSRSEDAAVNSSADGERSGGVGGVFHNESLATGLEDLGDPNVQERLMRETMLHALLNPPEMQNETANGEASGSGTIGGEVYAGTLGEAPSSLTVGYGCTYVASESVTMESSESHLNTRSPAVAGAVGGDGFSGAAASPVAGGGGSVQQHTGAGQLTMFDTAMQPPPPPPPSRDAGHVDNIISESFHSLFNNEDSIFRSWSSPPSARSSPPRPPPSSPCPPYSPVFSPSPPSPPSWPLPRSASSLETHLWQPEQQQQQQQQQRPGHGTAGLSAFSPEQQVNLADSAAWLFVDGSVLGEGAGVEGGGAVAAAVLGAPVPASASVDNTAGACRGGGGGGGGADDAPALRTTNGFTSWFRSPRSPSPGTGRMCRAMRAVSATLSSLVCPCFERMYDDDVYDDGQSDRERE
ncbi:unnamed protein product [Ectocarpus sp. 12 AP-2014]